MFMKIFSKIMHRRWLIISCCGVSLWIIFYFHIGWITRFSLQPRLLTEEYDSFSGVPKMLQTESLSQLLPSLPIDFWDHHKDKRHTMFFKNHSCALFPSIFDLKYSNLYWQSLRTSNYSFQLYKAFYDVRKINGLRDSVQIIAMIDSDTVNKKIYCQFWFEEKLEPIIVETIHFKYIWIREWGRLRRGGPTYGPYLVTCELPWSNRMMRPSCVSLVEKPCDTAVNLLTVIYEVPEKKKDFAVCVKGLDFLEADLSVRIVEWLEFLHLMGVSKVFFYKLHVHPNVEKVLQYYQSLGRVDVTHITLPEGQPNVPILQHKFLEVHLDQQMLDELIPYNDCFYRNIYSYRYIVPLDIDEVILPVKDQNWTMLMDRVIRKAKNNTFASYNVRNVYFLDDMQPQNENASVPPYMHMLQHVHRSRQFTPPWYYVKSFFDPDTVLTVHNHLPLAVANNRLLSYSIEEFDAQLNHYRKTCAANIDCDPNHRNITKDTKMLKYTDDLISRTQNVLKRLDFI